MSKKKLAVIGCGLIGNKHAKIIENLENLELCGVVENNQKLINELKTANNLSAFFKTVLCYFDGLNFITSEGVLKGNIVFEPRGKNGFGYDPIFEVSGKTLAEMTLDEKSNISHRKLAAVELVEKLNEI